MAGVPWPKTWPLLKFAPSAKLTRSGRGHRLERTWCLTMKGGCYPNAAGARISQGSLEAKILGCTSQYDTKILSSWNIYRLSLFCCLWCFKIPTCRQQIPFSVGTVLDNNLPCIPLHHVIFIYISFGHILRILFIAFWAYSLTKRGKLLAPGKLEQWLSHIFRPKSGEPCTSPTTNATKK